MNTFLNAILDIIKSLLGGGASDDETPAPSSTSARAAAVPEVDADSSAGAGAGDQPAATRAHALVLPDKNFRDWYTASQSYIRHFANVVVVRSPAGNNLNRYKIVTAVRTGQTWFNGDPVGHIRRAYPGVVTVDVIEASNPSMLGQVLNGRVVSDNRYGANLSTRFTLDWPTDSYTLRIVREFDVPLGGGKYHEGIDIGASSGTAVRAPCDGTIFAVAQDNGSLGYGRYVQVRARSQDGTDYLMTLTQLRDIRVENGDRVREGDLLAVSMGDRVKLVVQRPGINTGDRYKTPGAVDPVPLIYVDGLTLRTSADSGLNIRKGRGTEYEKVGLMAPTETANTLEMHGITVRKTGTPAEDNQWVNIDTSSGVTGFAAAWFLQARSPRSVLPADAAMNGVNLDVTAGIGRPDPARLGNMTYARFAYNVSRGRGSTDLDGAYSIYSPYIDSLRNADKKVILVYTHQTYGEGAGYVWEQMNSSRWRELAGRYADFLRVIARQYRGRIAAHQIWNEQDAPPSSEASVSMSATDYAYILTKAIQAIRSEDPTTPIITGGHTAGPQKGSAYARATLSAMPGGVRPDGIAAHPYGRGVGAVDKYEQFGHIRETVQEYGAVLPGRPIWITEWGVLNANNEPAGEVEKYATSVLSYMRRYHTENVAAMVWYAWAEGMHNGYGLVNAQQQAREPLFSAYTGIE